MQKEKKQKDEREGGGFYHFGFLSDNCRRSTAKHRSGSGSAGNGTWAAENQRPGRRVIACSLRMFEVIGVLALLIAPIRFAAATSVTNGCD